MRNFFLQMLRARITGIGTSCFYKPASTSRANRVFCAFIMPQGKLHRVCTYTFSIIHQKINKIRTQIKLLRKNVYANLQMLKELLFRLLKDIVF